MDKKQKDKGIAREAKKVKPYSKSENANLSIARGKSESLMYGKNLMEMVCERKNLKQALKRVKQNKGSSGVDGMTVNELTGYLTKNWLRIKEELYSGKYNPKAVKRIEIEKPCGGKRKLSIPCVVDRFIQQAILQVLQAKWDESFSENSFGFRPGKSAHQAIKKAQKYVKEGYKYLVDIDLKQFFDEVNHDKLMSSLAKRIEDKRVLSLIRKYLQTGIMENGLISYAEKGTAQGGPISPFLSNIVLDELDKELDRRGHRYVRYADDCNIYLLSKRSAKRVFKSISTFITKRLKLRINEEKSMISTIYERTFLGFTFMKDKCPNAIIIAPNAMKRFKDKVRNITSRTKSVKLEKVIEKLAEYINGWKGYFGVSEYPYSFESLDGWIRRRLRSLIWTQWKTGDNRRQELKKRKIPIKFISTAYSSKGSWRIARSQALSIALDNKYFDSIGLPRLHSNRII